MRGPVLVHLASAVPLQQRAGDALRTDAGGWLLLSGAAEEQRSHPTCGHTVHRCRPGTLLGGASLLFEDVQTCVRVTRDAVVVPIGEDDFSAMLADAERGQQLRAHLRMAACPRRRRSARLICGPGGAAVHTADGRAVPVGALGRFVWEHLDGRRSLRRLARTLAMVGERPAPGDLIAVVDEMVAAGAADAPRLRAAYSPKSKTR